MRKTIGHSKPIAIGPERGYRNGRSPRKKKMPAPCSGRLQTLAARRWWAHRKSSIKPFITNRPRRRRRSIVAENLFADRPDCDLGCCRRVASIALASWSAHDRRRYLDRHAHRRAAVPDGLHAWSRRGFVRDRHDP